MKLLVADDDINVIAGLKFLLEGEGYQVEAVTTPQAAIEAVKKNNYSLALLDLNYQRDTTSGDEGIDLIGQILAVSPALPIIVMTGWATVENAVAALKAGARDLLQKPWNDTHLLHALSTHIALSASARKAEKLSQQNDLMQDQLHPARREIVAESDAMKQLLATLEKLAKSDMNVLLTGENGTGKSMLAHYLHQVSSRHQGPFVAVNMAAIADNLFESEMFGHVKGAFTDASKNRIGRIELAESGTLFLDELATIPQAQQAKLLRVLEEKRFEPVGGSKSLDADVRVISATNADLRQMIEENTFRQDLYFRLNTIELRVPSLAERQQDILPLSRQFLAQFCAKYHKAPLLLSPGAERALLQYEWPGNIRELSHILERAVFLCEHNEVLAEHLHLSGSSPEYAAKADFSEMTLEAVERQLIVERLSLYKGNVVETARSLGLSRSGYYRRVAKYGLA